MNPTVIVDAARTTRMEPARSRLPCVRRSTSTSGASFWGVLADKDAAGIVAGLAQVTSQGVRDRARLERASDADRIADLAEAQGAAGHGARRRDGSLDAARAWAAASDRRAVVIAESVVLAGELSRWRRRRTGSGVERMTVRAEDAPRGRRPRVVAELLGSIVLAFESVIVFLGGLAAYGLKALPEPIPQWWAIVAGAVVAKLTYPPAVLRYRWGIVLGWVLQVVVALGGFLVPALFVVAIIFGGYVGVCDHQGLRWMPTRGWLPKPTPRTETDIWPPKRPSSVKPDGVSRAVATGAILGAHRGEGDALVDIRLVEPDRDTLERHYAEHAGKPFDEPLLEFMLSVPSVAIRLAGNRGDPGLPLPRRNDRSHDLSAGDDPRRLRPRLGTEGAAEPRARLGQPELAARELEIWFYLRPGPS